MTGASDDGQAGVTVDSFDHRPLGGGICVCSQPIHTVPHRYNPETGRCVCGALDHPEWGTSA